MKTWEEYKQGAEEAAARGDYATAESIWGHAMTVLEQKGESNPNYTYALDGLGKAFTAQKKFSQAELTFARSLKLKEAIFGVVSIEVAKTCNLLAAVFYAQGRYTETEALGERALSIYEKKLGRDHSAVATMFTNLDRVQKKIAEVNARAASGEAVATAAKKRELNLICEVCGRSYTGPSCLLCTQVVAPLDFGDSFGDR